MRPLLHGIEHPRETRGGAQALTSSGRTGYLRSRMALCPECRVAYGDDVQTCPVHGIALVNEEGPASNGGVLAPGTTVGEYVLGRLLGAGAFGEVYAGEHPLIGKRVAVKVL